MKTTLKEIREFLGTDVTSWSNEELYNLIDSEGGFIDIAYSVGYYGVNGLLKQGRNTHKFYKVTARTNAIYILH